VTIVPGNLNDLTPQAAVRRSRVLVLSTAAVVLLLKLWVAATTFGTNDVHYWESFAAGVRRVGPINIYALPWRHGGSRGSKLTALAAPYNHPPLIGWLLVAVNHLVRLGFSVPFLIRLPASVADVVTALLIFEMLRFRRSLRAATAAALLVACSPVLFIISGFHGNTDPVFVMFTLLSAYLLINRPWPAHAWVPAGLAGVAFALAVSVKLVPIVVLPTLLLLAVRLSRRQLASFMLGLGLVLLPLWGPVVLRQWQPFCTDVLGYAGIGLRQWGPVEFATMLHAPASVITFLPSTGRYLVLLVSSLLPAALLYWRRDAALPAIGLSLALFLLLSPAFGTQYLAWPVVAAYLIDLCAATAYNLSAGAFLAEVYNRWNGGLPWDEAKATPLLPSEVWAAAAVWALLLLVVVVGLGLIARRPGGTDGPPLIGQQAEEGSPSTSAESTPKSAESKPTSLLRRGSDAVADGSTGVPAISHASCSYISWCAPSQIGA
jgi:4-amino-4-deoxy-L-arabinose transferase-like glycosyltransferase